MWATSTFCLLHALSLYISTHTYRETGCGIWVCVYLYMCTWRNRLWYLGIQGISLLGLSVYLYTRTQRNRLWYLGIQDISLLSSHICIYKRIQRNRLWYLGIQGISLLGLSVYIYTHIQRDKQWYQGIQGISLLSSPYISLHTYRKTGSGIWVSRVSACCPLCICLYTHTEKQVMVSGYPG